MIGTAVHDADEVKLRCFLHKLVVTDKLVVKHVRLVFQLQQEPIPLPPPPPKKTSSVGVYFCARPCNVYAYEIVFSPFSPSRCYNDTSTPEGGAPGIFYDNKRPKKKDDIIYAFHPSPNICNCAFPFPPGVKLLTSLYLLFRKLSRHTHTHNPGKKHLASFHFHTPRFGRRKEFSSIKKPFFLHALGRNLG